MGSTCYIGAHGAWSGSDKNMFGMTRGEIGLVLIIFGMIYTAAFLPKIVAFLGGPVSRN